MIIDSHTHIFPDEVRKDREAFCKKDEGFSFIYKSSKAKMVGVEDVMPRWTNPESISLSFVGFLGVALTSVLFITNI